MASKERLGDLFKFFIYLITIILINMACFTLFFRVDLTSNKIYSLSDVSKEVVSTLSEPLTINVFFTKNLPAPYNNIEKYLHDLLEEYAISANKYFNYRFYDVSPEEGVIEEEVKKNQQLAQEFGIYPSQIQVLEKDELSFKTAYLGLAMVHGDIIEKVPEITSTERLEYKLTTAIQMMNNKISALLRLPDNINLKLFLSSSLNEIAPYMGLEGLSEIEDNLKDMVKELNSKSYGKLKFTAYDPTKEPKLEEELKKYEILSLEWPEVPEKSISAGKGAIGFVAEYHDRVLTIPLLRQLRIPLIGTQYELIDMEVLKDVIYESIESLIDINEDLGYLSDHGCINLWGRDMNIPGMPSEGSVSNFNGLASQTYSIKEVRLTDNDVLDGLHCLILASPKEPFTDYDLFRIDQFLMKGKSLAIFLDSFGQGPASPQGGPTDIPINTGLERLLEHYGISIKKSIVMDKNCYVADRPKEYGGGELPYYYVIRVMDEFINKDLAFMKNIRALLVPKASPLILNDNRIKENGLTAHRLLSSSEKSWEQKTVPNMNPLFMQPPTPDIKTRSFPLAYILEGKFPSFFAGKPVPETTIKNDAKSEETGQEGTDNKKTNVNLSQVKSEGIVISKGKPGKIFLIGTAEVLKNNLVDSEGIYSNAVFIMNSIDYLNNREETAIMRAKSASLNPLTKISFSSKTFIKYFNIIGLPVFVIIFGLLVWFYRIRRKRKIQEMFRGNS